MVVFEIKNRKKVNSHLTWFPTCKEHIAYIYDFPRQLLLYLMSLLTRVENNPLCNALSWGAWINHTRIQCYFTLEFNSLFHNLHYLVFFSYLLFYLHFFVISQKRTFYLIIYENVLDAFFVFIFTNFLTIDS